MRRIAFLQPVNPMIPFIKPSLLLPFIKSQMLLSFDEFVSYYPLCQPVCNCASHDGQMSVRMKSCELGKRWDIDWPCFSKCESHILILILVKGQITLNTTQKPRHRSSNLLITIINKIWGPTPGFFFLVFFSNPLSPLNRRTPEEPVWEESRSKMSRVGLPPNLKGYIRERLKRNPSFPRLRKRSFTYQFQPLADCIGKR